MNKIIWHKDIQIHLCIYYDKNNGQNGAKHLFIANVSTLQVIIKAVKIQI